MCLPKAPKPQSAAASPATIIRPVEAPVTASATAEALQIGGVPRGAAQLGRLKLRTGQRASSGSTNKRVSSPLSAALGLPTTGGAGGGGGDVVVTGDPAFAPYAGDPGGAYPTPNKNLRSQLL